MAIGLSKAYESPNNKKQAKISANHLILVF